MQPLAVTQHHQADVEKTRTDIELLVFQPEWPLRGVLGFRALWANSEACILYAPKKANLAV